MWHASVSLRYGRAPLPTAKWTRQQRREAERQARRLLAGVGGVGERGELYPYSFQLRSGLTDEELAGLDPVWCALPAVDEGGTPDEVRSMLRAMGLLHA